MSKCHGLQCGFCTPGILMSTTDYLEKKAKSLYQGNQRNAFWSLMPLHGV
ncbi:2Fe-2S iron-sulfur cluster-binding protein [Peribacillus frigoritolerans]|nr:2Fe-2S iron-sulfur cluster-binding protein [Peribacillus frigoritolerans]